MTTITLPPIEPTSATFGLVRGDIPQRMFTGSTTIVEVLAAEWVLSFPVKPQLESGDAGAWRAAIVQLARLANTFRASPPGYSGPSTSYAGPEPAVDGSGQAGYSVDLDGMTASSEIAKAGDFIEIGGELKCLTADLTSDGSGEATAHFEPALRSPPDNDSTAVIFSPKCTFGFVDPVARWNLSRPLWTEITIEAVERV